MAFMTGFPVSPHFFPDFDLPLASSSHTASLLLVTFHTHSCLRSLLSAIPLPTLLLPTCHPLGEALPSTPQVEAPPLPTPALDTLLWSLLLPPVQWDW